ncbi:MAG: hypothetical protein C0507_22560 [Cyanobacteria bacterium PR.3.49]|nr:hypothetical protein [Cyanobacteria bacterium PR.3.49]
MDQLKGKGTLTLVAIVCILLSVVAGFYYSNAGDAVYGMFHAMFPQMRDPEGGQQARLQLKIINTGAPDPNVETVILRPAKSR